MPQLNKSRKVWALLPFDYHKTDKEYPVLYLQDAQNLFNEGSEFGNWEIDKNSLSSLNTDVETLLSSP